ncbi:GYF domain-containing protein [Prosthecobacter sp.]|uniref:GYF domain-containing protein n=1 Tax=Prosthecobacter sp. TaxID=1965333 RepID=UPI003783B2CF
MDEWYYQRGETTFGPISSVVLHGLHKRGRLQDDTRVRKAGEAEWIALGGVMAGMPALPDAPSTEAAVPYTNAQPFDETQPAAAAVYAPPQADLNVQPEPSLHPALWFGMFLCSAALLFEIFSWSLVLMRLPEALDAANEQKWLPKSLQFFSVAVGYQSALFSTLFSAIAVAVWQGCAFASLKRVYGGDMIRRSNASGLWWFVPIASLFMPLLCLRDLRHYSRKRRDVINVHVPFGPLLIVMETLILIHVPLNLIATKDSSPVDASGHLTPLELVSIWALIVMAVTMLTIVIRNFLQQRNLCAHWRDDAYWQNPGGQ